MASYTPYAPISAANDPSSGTKRALDGGVPDVVPDMKKSKSDLRPGSTSPSNVVIVRVSEVLYPVTIDALHQIFSVYGPVVKIVMFDKGSGSQALIQYPTVQSGAMAYEALDCQNMYAGCNLLRVGYSNLNNITVKSNTDKTRDYSASLGLPSGPGAAGGLPMGAADGAVGGVQGGSLPSGYPSQPAARKPEGGDRHVRHPDLTQPWLEALPEATTEDGCTRVLHITNVDTNYCTTDMLAILFGVYGDVIKVKLLKSKEAALIQFAYPAMAFFARQHLDGCPLLGRNLAIAYSSQVGINDPSAADMTSRPALRRFAATTAPSDPVYQDHLVPPTITLKFLFHENKNAPDDELKKLLEKGCEVAQMKRISPAEVLVQVSTVESAVNGIIMTHGQLLGGVVLSVCFTLETI